MEDFLRDRGLPYDIVEPETIPEALTDAVTSLIVLGGPMGVYEADDYPQVRGGMRLMGEALKADIPVLGICLGAQMLARVLGARVFKGSQGQEVGWYDITLTPVGAEDPAFAAYAEGQSGPLRVFHWHGDTFDVPMGAMRLAGSEMYEAQAFRYGDKAYGLQFHIEVTSRMVAEWLRDIPGGEKWANESSLYMESFEAAARRFYAEFFRHVN
jgi:GMP synthase-like glutamine amidotransferase